MKKVKVAYLIPSLAVGGSEFKVIELANNLNKTKYEVIVITITNDGLLKDKLNSDIKYFCVGKKSKFDFLIIRKLKKILKTEKVDIMHPFTSTAKLWGRLAGIKAKTKVILSTEESLFRNSFLDRLFEKVFIKKTNKIICNSNSTKESAQKALKFKDDKYVVIYNGINLKPFLNNPKVENKLPTLICVARLDYRKGIDLLIEALNIINLENIEFRLNIVGDGLIKEDLLNLTNKYNLSEKINFLGFRNEIPLLLSNSDIFILPSREEGFGNAVIEAFASRVAVITSNAGGLKEIVNDNYNGLLFESGNYNDLALKLKELINDKLLREKLVENAFNEVFKYSNEVMVKSHEELYFSLIEGSDKP